MKAISFTGLWPARLSQNKTPFLKKRRYVCAVAEVRSLKNSRVKSARALLFRRHREKTNKILLEGPRLIEDALIEGVKPNSLFYTTDVLQRELTAKRIFDKMKDKNAECICVIDEVIASISDTVNPQGLVGIFEKPQNKQTDSSTTPLVLICDQVRDPGNLGSLLRSAAAAGIDNVFLTSGCADAWSLKTLRAGMGAQFRTKLEVNLTWDEIKSFCDKYGVEIRVADAAAEISYTQADWCIPSALVVGSEAHGPSEEAFNVGTPICIPMSKQVESLNAAMAGTVILFEAVRQRTLVSLR